MKIDVLSRLDPDFYKLSEQEFIINKQRSGTLYDHFPFIKNAHKFLNVVIKNECEQVVGGLIVKFEYDENYCFGSIGLVVITSEARGRGYSKLLLHETIKACKQKKIDYLLLWTSLHDFYAQFGFEVDEPLAYLEVNEQNELQGICDQIIVDFESQPTYTSRQGYLEYNRTIVHYLHDGAGYVFVSYSGDVATAIDIITNNFCSIKKTRVIIPLHDPLIRELYQRQPELTQHNYNYEMWLKLRADVHSKKILSFLQRI
ncbi:GNAT family N-acetyltransferase [Cedecea sp.]|jgi:N-acetylglutamate synthase-like GNAT family acetyltransferase|uniref:GNAT family N-acetyltransferase n=1 Tax=Cedecea sp. TaxID=1970739 RepID=UPI002F4182C2